MDVWNWREKSRKRPLNKLAVRLTKTPIDTTKPQIARINAIETVDQRRLTQIDTVLGLNIRNRGHRDKNRESSIENLFHIFFAYIWDALMLQSGPGIT